MCGRCPGKGGCACRHVKLPAHRAGLPGKELFNYIVPRDSACKAGLAGVLPVTPVAVQEG